MTFNLEEQTRRLIVLKLLTSVSGSFSDRAKRKFEGTRLGVGLALKNKPDRELPDDSGLSLKLDWKDEATKGARKTNLAIKEFKQAHPKYGGILQGMIDKHRSSRRAYLEFGGKVSDEVYVEIIREVMKDVDGGIARRIYDSIVDMGYSFNKKSEGPFASLLSE